MTPTREPHLMRSKQIFGGDRIIYSETEVLLCRNFKGIRHAANEQVSFEKINNRQQRIRRTSNW